MKFDGLEQLLGGMTVGFLIMMVVCILLVVFVRSTEVWGAASVTGVVCCVLFCGFGIATVVAAEHHGDVIAYRRALKREGFHVVSADEDQRLVVLKTNGCTVTLDVANNMKPTIFRNGPDVFFTPRTLARTARTLPGCTR